MLNKINKRIINKLQGDLPLISEPFKPLAKQLGLSQNKIIKYILKLAKNGFIRRFGATLRHQQSGFPVNVMVVWQVKEKNINYIGEKIASQRQITHCYWRQPHINFPYNLFSMVHGKNIKECYKLVKKIAKNIKINKYEMLFSLEELKKTSMQYYY